MGKSTGPRTPRGKARSSQNAAKHWVVSGRILPGEQKEAAILRSEFAEDFKPQGKVENELIDDLTFNRLIRRRIDIAFTRGYSKAAVEKERKLHENYERSATHFWLRAAGRRDWPQREQGERVRPELCIAALENLKRQIGDHGPQPQIEADLRCIYGDQPTEHAALAMYELTPAVKKKQTVQDGTAETADEKDRKDSLLDTLETEIEMQKGLEKLENDLEAIEGAWDLQEPPDPTLDILLRYRASNTREFKLLLDSLQRVRSLRRSAA
jgi:hypothetical protein